MSASPRLLAAVEEGLGRRWSPEQISARLKADHPDDTEMRISHETIYQSLFVQGKAGERFVYLDIGRAAGQHDTEWSRRLKVPLRGISREMADSGAAYSGL